MLRTRNAKRRNVRKTRLVRRHGPPRHRACGGLTGKGRPQARGRTHGLLRALEASRLPVAPERFEARELDGLPPPVARHLRQVLPDGTGIIREAAWYPTALLPSQGVRWEPIDDDHARATLVDGPLTLAMTFGFGRDGLLASMRVEERGRTVDGTVVPTPWEGRMWNDQRRDGLLVPLDGEVAWLTPAGRLPYWRGTITDITYHR